MRKHAEADFMAYVPLVSTLLDEADCRCCLDYDSIIWERRKNLAQASASETVTCSRTDMVLCIDALSELELYEVQACLDETASIAKRLLVVTMSRTPANETAGEPERWFVDMLQRRFVVIEARESGAGLLVLACPAERYESLETQLDFDALARITAELAPPPREEATRYAARTNIVQQYVGGFWLAVRDGRTPWLAKAAIAAACVLGASPLDLTPNVIPHVGYLDDIAILALCSAFALRMVAPVFPEFLERAVAVDRVRALRGSAGILLILVATVLNTALHAWRPTV